MYIIPAVTQVFLNHFVLGMEPLAAVQNPRVYHKVHNCFLLTYIITLNSETAPDFALLFSAANTK